MPPGSCRQGACRQSLEALGIRLGKLRQESITELELFRDSDRIWLAWPELCGVWGMNVLEGNREGAFLSSSEIYTYTVTYLLLENL